MSCTLIIFPLHSILFLVSSAYCSLPSGGVLPRESFKSLMSRPLKGAAPPPNFFQSLPTTDHGLHIPSSQTLRLHYYQKGSNSVKRIKYETTTGSPSLCFFSFSTLRQKQMIS